MNNIVNPEVIAYGGLHGEPEKKIPGFTKADWEAIQELRNKARELMLKDTWLQQPTLNELELYIARWKTISDSISQLPHINKISAGEVNRRIADLILAIMEMEREKGLGAEEIDYIVTEALHAGRTIADR